MSLPKEIHHLIDVPIDIEVELGQKTMTVAEFTEFLRRDREETGVLVRKYNVPKQ